MLTLGGQLPEGAWRVPILDTIAARGEGVVVLADKVEEHLQTLRASGAWARRERATLLDEVRGLVRDRVVAQVGQLFSEDTRFEQMLAALVGRTLDPVTAAEQVTAAAAASLSTDGES
jgi:LAO/AO transport system kinase